MWFWIKNSCQTTKTTCRPFPFLSIIAAIAGENLFLSFLQDSCNHLCTQNGTVLWIPALFSLLFNVSKQPEKALSASSERLWAATQPVLLMGRNLEETSGRKISNRNPHSRHTSAGPWGDLSICGSVNREHRQSVSLSSYTICLPPRVSHTLNKAWFSYSFDKMSICEN